MWTVVVPVKPSATAKTRLVETAPEIRAHLAEAFAHDAITEILASPDVEQLLIVGERLQIPTEDRVETIEDPGSGLIGAIECALTRVAADRPVAICVADLPAVRQAEVTAALRMHPEADTAIVADAEGIGTTMYRAHRADQARPRFGHRSRAAHVAAGAVDLSELVAPGLRLDVDTEVGLWNAQRLGVGQHTTEVLLRYGLA